MAISVTPAEGKPTPDVVSIQARTDADKKNRTVVISNIKLTNTRFPSADAAGDAKLGELVRTVFKPDNTMTISHDTSESSKLIFRIWSMAHLIAVLPTKS